MKRSWPILWYSPGTFLVTKYKREKQDFERIFENPDPQNKKLSLELQLSTSFFFLNYSHVTNFTSVNRALSGSSRRETLRGISGKCSEIHLKEEEESSNPCTGLANPHRTTKPKKLFILYFSSLTLKISQPLPSSSLSYPPKLASQT
jgi:hypothetical protein